MAKKRVNKVLVGAVAGVAVLGGGAFLASDQIKNIIRPVSKLIAAGDEAAQKGDWDTAALNYGKAVNRDSTKVDVQLKFLDAVDHTVRGDFEKFRNLRTMQGQFLANDPRNVPVLRRALAFQKNDVQGNPADNASLRNFVSTAQRLLSVVPNDREARTALVMSVLEPYQRNIDVKAEDVDKQRDEADKLFEEKPDDSEIIRMASMFRRVPMQRAAQAGDLADAQARAKANLEYIDAALKKAPNNAGVWISKAEIARDAATVLGQGDAKLRESNYKDFSDALIKANEIVKQDDPIFMQVRIAALRQIELSDPKQAEAGYKKLVEERPDDRQPRLLLAEFYGRQPGRQDDGVAVLEKPFTPSKPPTALESLSLRYLTALESLRRTSIRLSALSGVTDPAARKTRIAKIESEYRGLQSDPDINARYKGALMRVQGGIEAAQGRYGDAAATLDAARQMIDANSSAAIDQDIRNDVLQEYAQVQMKLNQPGEARPAIEELVRRRPEAVGARLLLANLLIAERNFDAAEQQVALFEKYNAQAPEVRRLRLLLDSSRGDKLKDRYKDLAEVTRDDRVLKLQAAGTLNDKVETKRLARLILAEDPADFAVVALLAANLSEEDDLAGARAVVDAAMKAKPDDKRFAGLLANLDADTPEKLAALNGERLGKIADPYERAAAEGDLARNNGKFVDAIAAYKKAIALNKDQARPYDALFQSALLSRAFAEAEAVLPDLERLDADQAKGQLRRVQLAGARAAVEPDAGKRSRMFAELAQQAQKAAFDNRQLATASLLYAQVLMQTGDYNAAIEQFNQTLDKSPRNVEALIGSADSLMRADRRNEALDRLTRLKAQIPNDARVRDLDMSYELRFGDPAKAIASLQKQVEADPNDSLATLRLAVALDQGSRSRDKTQDQKALITRCRDVYETAMSKFPQDLRFLVGYMDASRRLDQPDAAVAAVEKVAADPANAKRPEITALLAEQYVRSNKPDDAVRVLGEAVKAIQPAPADLVQQLALIQAQQNKVPDALATLNLRADDPNVQRQRITLLVETGDVGGARSASEAALAGKSDPDTLLLAAYVELRGGDFDKCVAYTDKVLALRPNDAGAYFYRAQARLNRKPPDLDAIRDDLVKSRDLSPSNADVRVTLSDVLRARGEPDASMAEIQSAWNVDHQNKLVLQKLVDAYVRATPPVWGAALKAIDQAKETVRLAKDADVLLLEAGIYAKRGDAPRAIAAARAARAIDPTNFALAQRYFDVLLQVKAYRDVLAETADSLGAGPQQWWFYHLRGVAFMGLDQKAEAKAALDQAFTLAMNTTDVQAITLVARTTSQALGTKEAVAKLDPFVDPSLQTLAAELLLESGDIAGTITRLEPLLADPAKLPAPVLHRVRGALGLAYLQTSPPQAAKGRPVFEALRQDTPNDVSVLNNLACVLLMPESGGTAADALPIAKQAYDLVTSVESGGLRPVVLDTYGWTLVKTGKTNEGLDMLRRAAETARFPDVFLHLAEAYLSTNNVEAAEAALGDAKTQIDDAAKSKRAIDPTVQGRFDTLTAELAKKKPAAAG